MGLSVFYENVIGAAKEAGITAEKALALIKDAGIEALDLDRKHLQNGLPEEIGQAGRKINSIYAFFDFTLPDVIREAYSVIDTASRYGAVAMLVVAPWEEKEIAGLKALTSKEAIYRWLSGNGMAAATARALEAAAVYGEQKGVKVCVENFDSHRSLTERKYELNWLFDNAPHLLFNPDTGNSVTCGEDIYELYTLFGDKTANVHCKERRKTPEGFPTAAVGEGEMPIRKIKNDLTAKGYTGRFSIEVFGVPDTLDAIIRSARYLAGKEF